MSEGRFEQEILNRNTAVALSLYEVLGIRARDLAIQGKALQAAFEDSKKEVEELLSSSKEGKR